MPAADGKYAPGHSHAARSTSSERARLDAGSEPSQAAAEKDVLDDSVDEDAEAAATLAPAGGAERTSADLPEGGLPGLKALAGAWCMSAASFGVVNSFVRCRRASIVLTRQAVINTELQRGLLRDESPANVSRASRSRNCLAYVSVVGSIQYALLLSSGLFVGRAFDRGWLLYLNCTSLVAAPFGIMMLSISTKLYQVVLSFGLLSGLALGPVYICSSVASTQWSLTCAESPASRSTIPLAGP